VKIFKWWIMAQDTKSSEDKLKYKEILIENPFLRSKYIWDAENEFVDKVKVRFRGQVHRSTTRLSDNFASVTDVS
jgi:hypothetical protein